ncbi:SURF1 family protein [Solicola gregarius]|uniref:SURF1-like protein n=1 Tax=Solicola gregarius TaxID=2908642 RepID=A0AA46TN29_9ACTN|nr:SURF1 family protein [Solicola gregarius]UYM07403.1 SURF1 family protein [Solicola gregarius]
MRDDAPEQSSLRVLLRPPMLGLHALGVVAVVFTIVMGLWQLGVYDTRQEHERADKQDVPTVPLDEALGPDDAFSGSANHRPVEVTGTFAPADEQVWVSGRSLDGEDGYWLLAPLVVRDTEALLVVRGWSPTNDRLPAPPSGATTIDAVLQFGEDVGAPLGADRTTDTVRIPALANELPYDLYSGYAIQTEPAPGAGLETVPPPDPDVSWSVGLRNLVYAVQWWVFGAFAVFMWVRMCRDVVRDARGRRGDDGQGRVI